MQEDIINEFREKFTDTCGNWIPKLSKEDALVESDIMFEPKDIEDFIIFAISKAKEEGRKQVVKECKLIVDSFQKKIFGCSFSS